VDPSLASEHPDGRVASAKILLENASASAMEGENLFSKEGKQLNCRMIV